MAATPIRSVKIGPLWTTAQEFAATHGVTMTAFVEVALILAMENPEIGVAIRAHQRDGEIRRPIRSSDNPVLAAAHALLENDTPEHDDLLELLAQLSEAADPRTIAAVREATPAERRVASRILERLLAVVGAS